MGKPTSIRFSDENAAYLTGIGGSITEVMNDLVAKLRTGQVAPITSETTGDLNSLCIFNIAGTNGDKIDFECPPKHHIKALQKPEAYVDLLKACARCPRFKEHMLNLKEQKRYPKVFAKLDDAEATYTPPEEQKPKYITLTCEACGAQCSTEDYSQFGNPLLACRNGLILHVKARHFREHLTPKEWPAHLAQKVRAA